MDMTKVTVNGRYCANGDILWLTMSGSGIAFTVSGAEKCSIRLHGDRTAAADGDKDHRAGFEIRVDGKTVLRETMDLPEKGIKVLDDEQPGDHRVELIKLSECTSSILGIGEIRTDGIITPVEQKGPKLLVIGDSITCGYGVFGDLTQQFTTATEDATAAYGWLAADKLDMDVQLVCFSGFGIISGYTDTGVINEECLVPTYYEKCGLNAHVFPDGTRVQDIPWDFDRFNADRIVINLGTNDLSYCREDTEKKERFRDQYAAFLKTVRLHDPKAKILCILGVMGTGLNTYMEDAVRIYSRETGDGNIRSVMLEEQDQQNDGVGTNWHPSPVTQKKLAERVCAEIRKWMAEE